MSDVSLSRDELEELLLESGENLQPCPVDEGIDRFINHKRPSITATTAKSYDRKLARFEEFLATQDVTDLNELDGRTLNDYLHWRRYDSNPDDDALSNKTMRDEAYILRDFTRFLESIDAVSVDLNRRINIPDLGSDAGVRNTDLSADRVEDICDHLERYRYASLEHVVWQLLVKTGRRTSGIRALDVGDVHLDEKDPYVDFVHRPPETRLKNGVESETPVSIDPATADIVSDYLDTNRPDVTDSIGRKPLLATRQGRISSSTVRRYCYSWTRPCELGKSCPHGRSPQNCEAATVVDKISQCPSSRSPHGVRHGYISELRREALPIDLISDRVDASEEVIRKHYDESSPEDRLEIRREMLAQHASHDNGGGYL